ALLGATTAATIHTAARVDGSFALRSFDFSLDPGTGAVHVRGAVDAAPVHGTHRVLRLLIASKGGTQTQDLELAEAPVLSLNASRMLASGGLVPGTRRRSTVFDPATLTNAPVEMVVGKRGVVHVGDTNVPAFRVDTAFQGLSTTSWVTDTGEVVREESP